MRALRPSNRHESIISAAARRRSLFMTPATWITMIVVMTFVWGGFSMVLLTAVRKESGKSVDR